MSGERNRVYLMDTQVRHEPEQSRYVLSVDGVDVGVADYRIFDDQIAFTHTEVDPKERNKGYGAILVRGAMDDVRDNSTHGVIPACPFVATWVKQNPEYQALVQRNSR